MRQTNVPAAPGVFLDRFEIVGEISRCNDLSITTRLPVIVLDDITTDDLFQVLKFTLNLVSTLRSSVT